MVMRLVFVVFSVVALLVAGQANCLSQEYPGAVGTVYPILATGGGQGQPGSFCSLGFSKFLNSFTSYEFPNPFPPGQDPLSRLEFPLDQWFVGLRAVQASPSWSLVAQGWINLNRESALEMQDSDWDDESQPAQKTIFSESKCRLNRGIMIDVGVTIVTPLSVALDIRPVLGGRYQYFNFTTHDGLQEVFGGASQQLDGDGIEFRQVFYHYYLGANLNTALTLGLISRMFPPVRLQAQMDYAFVTARNEDLHLLRAGDRITEENTRGHCWHGFVSAEISMLYNMKARVEADFKRLLTNGSHRLTNSLFGIDFSFNGSTVWSDQVSVSAVADIAF